jgi:predicted AlkP superfamily pyrophosphatase or phosphodiesterase
VPPVPPGTPRLTIFVVVDQLPADYLVRFAPYLKGGLGRLLAESVVYRNAVHRHAMTKTAPGHATLATGMDPARHGIIDNWWLDRASGEEVEGVDDDELGISPNRLLTTSLPDWLAATYPQARIFTVGGKDRGAVFLGGKKAQGAFWYDDDTGRFRSSAYYRLRQPAWLEGGDGYSKALELFGTSWEPLPETLEAAAALSLETPDRGIFPNDFPHSLGSATPAPRESFFGDLFDSPFVDQLTLGFALEVIEQEGLGKDSVPDYLGVSLAALDTVGHDYGPESVEVLDTLLRLDRQLGFFLDRVDQLVGLDQVLISLSSDHGIAPVPEIHHAATGQGMRFGASETRCIQQLYGRLGERFGAEPWFRTAFFLDRALLAERGVDPKEVEDFSREVLEACPQVQRVWTRHDLLGELPENASPETRLEILPYRRSFHPERSPDLFLQLTPYTLTLRGTGTTHGSPYDYDQRVPWLLRLPDLSLRGQVLEPVATVDVAPTVAALMGLKPPPDLDGRDRLPGSGTTIRFGQAVRVEPDQGQ